MISVRDKALQQTVVEYGSAPMIRQPRELARQMASDAWLGARVAPSLVVRSLRSQYRGSLGGLLWVLGPPIATALLWVMLVSSRVVAPGGEAASYPAFIAVSLSLWFCFADGCLAPLRALNASTAFLGRVRLPYEAFAIAGLGEALVHIAVRTLVVGVVLQVVPFHHGHFGFALLVAAMGLLMLGLGIGLWIAPLSLLSQDFGRAFPVALQLLLYATPIVYAMPEAGFARRLGEWNPVAKLVDVARVSYLGASSSHTSGDVAALMALCLAVILTGWLFYVIAMPRVVERLGA